LLKKATKLISETGVWVVAVRTKNRSRRKRNY